MSPDSGTINPAGPASQYSPANTSNDCPGLTPRWPPSSARDHRAASALMTAHAKSWGVVIEMRTRMSVPNSTSTAGASAADLSRDDGDTPRQIPPQRLQARGAIDKSAREQYPCAGRPHSPTRLAASTSRFNSPRARRPLSDGYALNSVTDAMPPIESPDQPRPRFGLHQLNRGLRSTRPAEGLACREFGGGALLGDQSHRSSADPQALDFD
jgi:hypothetical protein